MIEIPFSTQLGESQINQNSREILTNMFASIEVSGRKQIIRRQRPGLVSATAINGEKRCIERNKTKHWMVIADKLYEYDGTTLTTRGTLATSSGRCSMIFNDNDEVMVSDGVTGYVWNGTTFSTVASTVNIGPLAYHGGFGLFSVPGTGQFFITGLNNFTSIGALDFATAESYSDDLLRVFVDHNEVWLAGEYSMEVWQLSGASDFPFARFTNAQIERGIMGPYGMSADDNTVFWAGDDGVVYRADGYRPQRISTHPIEDFIRKVPDAVKVEVDAFVYTIGGHKFFTLRFPGQLTIQYNISTGLWNKAKTKDVDDWQILGSAVRNTDFYLTTAGVVQLDVDVNTDEGTIMERGGVSAPGYSGGDRITANAFWMDAEVGRADVNKSATVMLRVSRDGETFGNERWRSLGSQGDYKRRAMWRDLGQSREITLEFMLTDDVNFAVMDTQADFEIAA